MPAGLSHKFRWPGALLGWPSKTRTLARSRDAADWPFGSFSLKKKGGLQLVFPIGFENTALYVSRPPHTVHSTITTVNEDLHTGLIYKHTKEMGRSSASQCEVCYLICRVWDQLLMLYYPRTRIFQGKACRLAWKKIVRGRPHKYKANVSQAFQADVFWCVKLGGSCFEFIYWIQQSHVGNRAKIQSVARRCWEHLVGQTSIMPRAWAESCQHEAANQSIRGVSSPHWRLTISPGVKTEGMTLQLTASHIYGLNLRCKKAHLRPTALLDRRKKKTKHLFSHFVHSRVSHILTRGEYSNCRAEIWLWVLTENVNSGDLIGNAE